MKNSGFVYKWTNAVNGKWYIGSHKGTVDDGYRHSSKLLSFAEQKYGLKSFTREILFEGDYDQDRIRDKEAEYLQMYDAANNPMSYNKTNISGQRCFSEETRKKMSLAQLGKTQSEITLLRKSLSLKGKNKGRKLGPSWNKGLSLSQEHRQKLSQSHTGKPLADMHRTNISKALTGIPKSKISCPHCNKMGGIGAMKRWHFNLCRSKKNASC